MCDLGYRFIILSTLLLVINIFRLFVLRIIPDISQ